MLQTLTRNKLQGLWLLLIVALAVVPLVLPSTMTLLLTRILIMALFATSLNLEVGYGGMLPIGQAMFLGLGAYSYGLLILKGDMPVTGAIFCALALGIIFNLIIGYLCLRAENMAFGLLHMAFNILLANVVNQWVYFTGGSSGLSGVPRPSLFSSNFSFYYFVMVIVVICIILMWILVNSPFGKTIQGLRENDERLIYLGINVRSFRLVMFVIAGFFATLAGILMAMLNTGAFPDYMSPIASAEVLMMILIGGMGSFLGPSLGALITVILMTEVSNYLNQWQGMLGAIIIVCVLIFRGGILGRKKSKARIKSIMRNVIPATSKSTTSPEETVDK